MITLKFQDKYVVRSRVISTSEYVVTPGASGTVNVEVNDETIIVSNGRNDEHYNVCYVMNEEGRTIDTIRASVNRPQPRSKGFKSNDH